jgi:hypothetical protein
MHFEVGGVDQYDYRCLEVVGTLRKVRMSVGFLFQVRGEEHMGRKRKSRRNSRMEAD